MSLLLPVLPQGMHPALDLENHKGKVTEWLDNPPVKEAVKKQFKKFLRTFKDDNGEKLYSQNMENMVMGKLLTTDCVVLLVPVLSRGEPDVVHVAVCITFRKRELHVECNTSFCRAAMCDCHQLPVQNLGSATAFCVIMLLLDPCLRKG